MLTRGYNNERTQATVVETILTPQNVTANGFGRVFKLVLKAPPGQPEEPLPKTIYAAPLYASAVSGITGSPNVVYIATVNNFVYAFNADTGDVITRRDFNGGNTAPSTMTELGQQPGADPCGKPDSTGNEITGIWGKAGIIGTPVIDAATSTMFFVTHTMESGTPRYRLRAVDIATLADRPNSPQLITDVDGTFNNQRAALALANGAVYIPFSSYCDRGPGFPVPVSYHGWLVSYDTSTLSRIAAFNVSQTPDPDPAHGPQVGGGIWQSAAAPAIDSAGNVYVATGNGYWNGVGSFGNSLLKLRARDLVRLNHFTTTNWPDLNGWDGDFGTSGPSVLPVSPQRVVQGTKTGHAYVLPTSNLGGAGLYAPDAVTAGFFRAIPPNFVGDSAHNHTGFVLWNGPNGLNAYVRGENTPVYAYRYNSASGTFTTPAFASASPTPIAQAGHGGMLSLSANGSTNGILWNNTPIGARGQTDVLHALNAETLAPLWNSRIDVADDVPSLANWQLPVVANGRTYMTAYANEVLVFGRIGTTIGVYGTSNQTWLLRARAEGGAANFNFAYGMTGDIPVVGDWNGNGSTTIGVFRPSTVQWLLRNSNSFGSPEVTPFAYGQAGDIPIVGDWDGNWTTTIGVFRPSTVQWFLRNSNSFGSPDITPFAYGQAGDIPVVGDWDGNGTTTIGVYRPSTAQWLLRNSNTPGQRDIEFAYGAAGQGDIPVVGKWNGEKRPGDARDFIGVYRLPGTTYNNTTSSKWLLRNSLTTGDPNIEFSYGTTGDKPVTGQWYPPPGCPLQVCCPTNSVPSRVCETDSCPIVCPPPPF
ncbi:MAG TPA: hypothetical protein VK540_04770 [Polyangiaceae bacterium]|nr:hypothetical protein [Polyangiaceae bacterium]